MRLLYENIDTILNGSPQEKALLAMHYYKVADTPDFLKTIGLCGDAFVVKYGVITRHRNKNPDHTLTAQHWKDICSKIADPLAVATFKGNYRLFVDSKINEKYIMVGVDVKQRSDGAFVNAVTTAFGRTNNNNARLLYADKKIAAEKLSFLTQHNPAQYPTDGGLSGKADTSTILQSAEKSSEKSTTQQGASQC